jgi:hypothetical protein
MFTVKYRSQVVRPHKEEDILGVTGLDHLVLPQPRAKTIDNQVATPQEFFRPIFGPTLVYMVRATLKGNGS